MTACRRCSLGVAARRRQEDDEPADDLDDSTQLVLSMLSLASVVVDDQDEVVRANPAAYRLGLVRDDTLIEPTLLDAVHKVMKDGSRCSFDLETQTPEQFMTMNGFGAAAADDGLTAEASSRPNWLKVTVGRIGDHLVLVLINDVSESIRFAQIRDSFISNVSEQLLQPTRALERLADSLESADVSYEQLSNHARQVRHSCVRLDRMISDLLMLIKAQEPVTASEANRCDLFSQVSGAVDDLAGAARDAGVQVRVGGKSPVMIHGEADQIRMAVRKMVENAIVYSHPGGAVGVRRPVFGREERRGACHRSWRGRAEGRSAPYLRTVLPRFQPERAHDRRHRSGIGDRQACGARPSRRCDGVERSRAGQHVHAVAAGGGLIRLSCRDAGNPSGRNAPIPAS